MKHVYIDTEDACIESTLLASLHQLCGGVQLNSLIEDIEANCVFFLPEEKDHRPSSSITS